MFVPKVPLETAVKLKCETNTITLVVNTDSENVHDGTIFKSEKNFSESTTCKVRTNILKPCHIVLLHYNKRRFHYDTAV